MNERSNLIHRLIESVDSRASYIKAKLGVLVPSQIRSLRLQSEMPRQSALAKAAGLHQSRISMFETPGAANMTIETLTRVAAAFKVGLKVEFVPFSEMLRWENGFSQDTFYVTPIDGDCQFQNPKSCEPEQAFASGIQTGQAAVIGASAANGADIRLARPAPFYAAAQGGNSAAVGGMQWQ
jgi:transcriptional regulator with XRE-family HTH domain